MKHTLFFFIFLTLQDGNTGLVNAETHIRRAVEGGNITVGCIFSFSGETKRFCKEECKDGGILVETSKDAAQNGRYSIKYKKKDFLSNDIMYVSITQLKTSDSGRYRCSLDRLLWRDPNYDFELIVTEAPTSETPNVTLRPFSASGVLARASTPPPPLSGSSAPPSDSTPLPPSGSSGSGSSTPPSASAGSSDVLLYVGLILLVMITIFLAALLIFCKRKRATKHRGPPEDPEHAEENRLYEEISDVACPPPPVEVSSVYATVKGPRPQGGEGASLYSLITAPQNKVEDHSHDLSYSEVDISHIPAACSAPCGNATHVVYSGHQGDLSSANHSGLASPPLYSTVTSV